MTLYRFAPDGTLVPEAVARRRSQRVWASGAWQRAARAQVRRQPWCAECGATRDLTADHIVALAAGGHPTAAKNLQTLCRSCNGRKGAR